MRFLSTHDDEPLDAIVQRAYAFEQPPSKAAIARARRALLDANPVLGERKAPAMVIAIPELDGAGFGDDVSEPDATALRATAGQLAGALRSTRDAVLAAAADQLAEAHASVSLAKDRELQTLARTDERLGDALPAARDAATGRVAAVKDFERYAREAFAAAESDLADLARSFG